MRVEHWFYTIRLRLRSLFRRKQVEHELGEELQFHIDQQISANIAKGISPEEARYAAIRAMNGVEQQKERCRAMRRTNFIDQLMQDLSYGFHVLRSKPGFTFIAVLTLALAIGASTAVFSAEDAVILRVLPFKEPSRLVQIFQSYHPRQYMNRMSVSPANYADWQKESKSFEAVAAYKLISLNLSGDERPERVRAGQVTTNTFSVLGAEPLFGRTFQNSDSGSDGESVALISYNLWQSRYAGNKDIIGRVIKGNNKSFTVIGVMPQGFNFPIGWMFSGDIEIWTPLALTDNEKSDRGGIILDVIARLKPGVTLQQAQSNLDVITQQLEQAYPQTNKDWGCNIMPLSERGVEGYRAMFFFLSLSVLVVLLIACANTANLLLARGIERQKELTIRAALGAGRWRLIRQLLTEGILLSSFGGALGV